MSATQLPPPEKLFPPMQYRGGQTTAVPPGERMGNGAARGAAAAQDGGGAGRGIPAVGIPGGTSVFKEHPCALGLPGQ